MDDQVLASIRTPHKLNHLLITPSYEHGSFDSHAVDCPFLFRHDGTFYMTYVGWDTIGYRTGLAWSVDLKQWTKLGMIIDRGPAGSLTAHNVALTSIMRDNDLWGEGTLKQIDGQFVGTYHAYPDPGYEKGPGAIGLCHSRNLREWSIEPPILFAPDGTAWERGGLYKSWVLEHNGTFYLFYNAKNKTEGFWHEQIGVALSNDLRTWKRHPQNPVISVGAAGSFRDRFASDPCVLFHDGRWIMFFFGLSTDGHAREGVAFSRDLLHWTVAPDPIIDVGLPGSIDSRYAHKPGIITNDDMLYHFYCAVSPTTDPRMGTISHEEVRGITAAHS
jgi:predicted GH43/DUF377 family glycosyl hydrolase